MRDNNEVRRTLLAFLIPIFSLSLICLIYLFKDKNATGFDYELVKGHGLLGGGHYLKAIEKFQHLVERRPSDAQARALLGIAQLRLHLYLSAIDSFEEALRLAPNDSDPLIGLAHARLALRDIPNSIENAIQATELEPHRAEAWLVLAQGLWMNRSYADAESAAIKTWKLIPDDARSLEILLRTYMDSDKPDKFEALIEKISKDELLLQKLVVAFFVRQGQFEQAWKYKTQFERKRRELAVLEAELALARGGDPDELVPQLIRDLVSSENYEKAVFYGASYIVSEPVHMEIAKAYWMVGDIPKAVQRLRLASSRGVHKLSAEVALAVITGDVDHWREAFKAEQVEKDYLVLGQIDRFLLDAPLQIKPLIWRYVGVFDPHFYNRAVQAGIKLDERELDDLDVLLTIGTAYERLGRLDESERYLKRAQEAYPFEGEPWSRLATIAIRQGESTKAKEFMQRALSMDPTNAKYLYNFGWMHDQMGQKGLASNLYEEAIQASDLSFEAMNNLAIIYSERGQGVAARRLLDRAISVDSNSEAAFFNLARYHSKLNEWRLALDGYDRVLAINPLNSNARLEKARIWLKQGQIKRSVELLNEVVELNAQEFQGYLLLITAYEKLKNLSAALGALQEATRINPDYADLVAIRSRLKEVAE